MRRVFAIAIHVALSGSVVQAADVWQKLKNCRLLPNAANDADSFHVEAGGREYIFRLYFVDAPETDMSVAGRVDEQARYFAVTPSQTLQLGELGKRFSGEKLARPFTVRTCLQDARGRSALPRYFAFVETTAGDLGELLVANGLARVYGAAAAAEGLSSPEREWQKLRTLELKAKAEKVGAWGVASGRMAARAAVEPAKVGVDSFDAFFHPAGQEEPALASAPIASASAGKLDVNTATAAELLTLKGVGAVTAARIIEARPFPSADDLRKVKGIGAKRYEQLRPYFR